MCRRGGPLAVDAASHVTQPHGMESQQHRCPVIERQEGLTLNLQESRYDATSLIVTCHST